ncbi:MAG: diacylglycerol kinase family protein [Bacteroidota bacterium]|nr:diacylglycerol kinase family protein [Bacillota bacterium]MDP4291448.1 diacylglycerol kinase family protein [Bacteroidota bacterium]
MIDKNKNQFSTRKRLLSFVYAYHGILYLVRTQHNAWIHLGLTAIAIILGFLLSISQVEWIAIVLCIGIVFAAEAFNTSIEMICDARFPDYDKRAEIIKDTAAGAVLFVAMAAAITGCIIFLPKLFPLLT